MNILVIDDDPLLRSTYQLLLERLYPDAQIHMEASGTAAVGVLHMWWDVIICDYSMKGMNGHGLYAVLSLSQRSRFLLCTADAIDSPSGHVLYKPFSWRALHTAISKITGS